MTTANALQIPAPRLQRSGPDLWRVEATIEGHNVFFESSVALSPRPEVFVCPFFLPAMARHAGVEVSGALDPRFIENLAFVRTRAMEWWPKLGGGQVHAQRGDAHERGPHLGGFYTGGVDSSYLLQQLCKRLRYAVFVEGFDIPLDDSARLASARTLLSATAKACGVEFLVVRTNLREHPFFNTLSWEITHISALAAVAHALGLHVNSMWVAASDVPPPWGSAPDLDAAWSSGSVTMENFSAEISRLERARSIARWEPLRGRLRVCWENNTSDLNCGFCEKCVRTRMQLYVSGAPDGLDSFPAGHPLGPGLARLHLEHSLHGQWQEIASHLDDPALRAEIDRALKRRRRTIWQIWRGGMRLLKRIRGRAMRRASST